MILKQIPHLSFVFVITIRFLCKFNYKIGAEMANWHQFVLRSCYPIAFFPLLHIRNTTELVAVRDSPLDVFTRA